LKHTKGKAAPDGATAKVFQTLQKYNAYMSRKNLVKATQLKPGQVGWAVDWLRANGLVSEGQDIRNPRYLRYRIKAGAVLPVEGGEA
jgi:hypothetical protein